MSALTDFGTLVLIVAAMAAMLAGISKAGFGSGIAAVATPMLALTIDPILAVGAMLPVLMVVDLAAVRAYWGQWHRETAQKLIFAAMFGIAIGALLHSVTNPDFFRVAMGVLALGFSAWQVARKRGWIGQTKGTMNPVWIWPCGATGGFTSFVSHSGGPPMLIYLLNRNLPKAEFLATTVLVFWAVNLMKLPVYIALGFYSGGAIPLMLWMVPFALAGVRVGLWASRRLSEQAFFGLTYAFLVFAGVKLIYDGLT